MRFSVAFALVLFVFASPALADEPVWTTERDDFGGDIRRAAFNTGDAGCAYRTMADVGVMDEILEHLVGVEVHETHGFAQDVTFTEDFFAVGLVHSRYHRLTDGAARIEWTLVSGKQQRHDGFWQVQPDGSVFFENVIQAKSRLHQPLLRRIQIKTMAAIVQSVQDTCGPALLE